MTIKQKEILEKFRTNPCYLKSGAGKLAKQFGSSIADIYKVKEYLKRQKVSAPVVESIKETGSGEQTQVIKSNKPLSPAEIAEFAGVDGVTSYVTNYWLKSQASGIYTYSVQVKKVINDFYSLEDLENKLQKLIPKISPIKLKKVKSTGASYDTLMVYISDIHAGAQNSELNIHGLSYSEKDLMERLELVLQSILELDTVYEKLVIVNLGDSVDGWDGFTTRKGHSLGSLSNRDQFDIYFRCMGAFYSTLFESGVATEYLVWNCLDSNHEGVDFSYICNKNVENFLKVKYPQVDFFQQDKFIDILQIGQHAFAFTHGKDSKIMKYPMKKHLDDKLDSWAQQYFKQHGFNNTWNHIVKGDLHSYAHERGKFGTYLNIPSIYGTSDYISLNFGVGRPGAVIEEVGENVEKTRITPIWL